MIEALGCLGCLSAGYVGKIRLMVCGQTFVFQVLGVDSMQSI